MNPQKNQPKQITERKEALTKRQLDKVVASARMVTADLSAYDKILTVK